MGILEILLLLLLVLIVVLCVASLAAAYFVLKVLLPVWREKNRLFRTIGIGLLSVIVIICVIGGILVITRGENGGTLARTIKDLQWNTIADVATAIGIFFAGVSILADAVARRQANVVNSGDFALRLQEYYDSDRFLRVRHGALQGIVQIRMPDQEPPWVCECDISPYSLQGAEAGLNSDLRDVFNFYNMVGDLVAEKAIREDVALESFAFGVRHYYKSCEEQIKEFLKVLNEDPVKKKNWENLESFYQLAVSNYGTPEPDDIDTWLLREHARTHRGPLSE